MLKKITENVEIHQTLPDIPNLTPEELKKEWDKGCKIIKQAFNELIDSLIDAEVLESKKKFDYSTEEQVIGKWIDGKSVYRKIITGSLTKSGTYTAASLLDTEYDTITKLDIITKNTDPITSQYYSSTTSNIRCYIVPASKQLKVEIGSEYPTVPLDYIITLEYTKTID